MAELQLPTQYRPFRELNLCSNVLINVRAPLAANGQPLLLVGRGTNGAPLVWLAARMSPESKVWAYVVEAGRPLRPLIVINTDNVAGAVTVHVGGTLAVKARKVSDDTVAVDSLDLRPLGLVVYGSTRELHIGGMMMERNTLENLGIAFAIGEPPEQHPS